MSQSNPPQELDATTRAIPLEESALLDRVIDHLKACRAALPQLETYDQELLALRDQVSESRAEDVPALLAEMERLAGIGAQRSELKAGLVDPSNPYFAHIELRETDSRATRDRQVLIGHTTYLNSDANIRIVDWRHAPVSQIYYRYGEGDEYDETFGDREVSGTVLTRRTVSIYKAELLRVASPQGTFVRRETGDFRWIAPRDVSLQGGQGQATRPADAKTRGQLGVGDDGRQRMDRHLPEISALLDPRQFELISRTDAGIAVIQGGAGSGKTTIGLHRLAFLNYQGPNKFAGDRMMVVTTSKGLVAYISTVLPALGVHQVNVTTFLEWASKQRKIHFPWLGRVSITEETPTVVARLKKHPAVLHALEKRCRSAQDNARRRSDPVGPVTVWAELLTDLEALRTTMQGVASPLSDAELRHAHRWCSDRCPLVANLRPGEIETRATHSADDDDNNSAEIGIDGLPAEEDHLSLDPDDLALLLRAHQVLRGPLRKGREPIEVEHLFVDEAQDFSVAELAILFDLTTERRSITLAGDISQRLVMENAFTTWEALLASLGMQAFEVEPLKIAYRSTREILELARHVLGPDSSVLPTLAPRTGAPVEMFISPSAGVAVAQIAEALRALSLQEPRATVAVLARYSEQADMYFAGLRKAEVPNIRRIKDQDFWFRPGVEVVEIRDVKGLEYDYVIVVEVNASTFPEDLESRHLLHVAATRAAHQLWIFSTGPESKVLPDWLVSAAL